MGEGIDEPKAALAILRRTKPYAPGAQALVWESGSAATLVGATGGTGISYDVMYCGARRTPMLEAPVALLVVLLVEADALAAFCGVRV